MNLIIRKASVRWKGGRGESRAVTTESGMLKRAKFSLGAPGKGQDHTDPAELIAAAHAASFSQALSRELKLKPLTAGTIITVATVTLERHAGNWTVMNIHLGVLAQIPKLSQSKFIDATLRAKSNCLVSRLLNATISMNAKLEKGGATPKTTSRRARA